MSRLTHRLAAFSAALLILALLLAPAQAAPERGQTVSAGGYTFAPGAPVDIPEALRGSGDLYIVQFPGPIQTAWVEAVESLGAEVYNYIPDCAFVVRMDAATHSRVAESGLARWVGPYHAAYRIDPDIATDDVADLFEATVLDGMSPEAVLDSALALGLDARLEGDVIVLSGTGADAQALAQVDGVSWIHRFQEPQLLNDVVRTIIASDIVNSHGVTGSYIFQPRQIAAITDTGVYDQHECFLRPGKMIAYIDYAGDGPGDGHGHGTHCAGTVLGDAKPYDFWNTYDGHAYGADYVAVKVFTNAGSWAGGSNYYQIWLSAYRARARVNSNSWGSACGGAYATSSLHADRITWDYRDYTLTVSAGNSGAYGPNTVGCPATAKNVVTVGATEKINPENVTYFSSRGPTDDERIKPDVMAPGYKTMSAQAGTFNGYVTMSGTSMSNPAVAGAATLVRDYYMLGYYPSGAPVQADAFTPTSALIKATLINGAVEMTGVRSDWNGEGVWPNNAQGWGRVHLDNSLYFDGDPRLMKIWERSALKTGELWVGYYHFKPTTRSRCLKVTLVWTDYPGSTLVNDLHLEVYAPNGTIFRGNNFVGLNPGYSVPGGPFDYINNVEGVHLLPGYSFGGSLPPGTYKILVHGANIPQPFSNFAVVVTEYDL